jgi:mannose-6-phosphate isomerase
MHAIDVGWFLYEVQQNSDTTYRVHDWDRFDSGGGPRPLHLAKALAVTHWDDPGGEAIAPRWLRAIGSSTLWEVLDSEHFHVLKLALADSLELISTGESFHILYVEDGAVSVTGDGQTVELVRGTSALLPAALMISRLTVRDANGASLLVTLRGGSALRTKLIGS